MRPGATDGPPDWELRQVAAGDTEPLRRAVLRAGTDLPLPADDPDAFHLAAIVGSVAVSTGNVRREPPPSAPDQPGWRLRGMATAVDRQGQGLGRAVLDGLVAHCRDHGGGVFWCNARVSASAFYARAGLTTTGEVFDVPGIGPHVQMWRRL